MNFREIYDGWKNHLFPPEELKAFIKNLSEERLSICKPCEHNTTEGRAGVLSTCKVCGCPLIQKSKSPHSECPIKKWEAVLTPEESEQLNKEIGDNNDES